MLHLLAILLDRLNRPEHWDWPRVSLITISLTRAAIYLGLITAWGFSIRYRLPKSKPPKYLMTEAGLMVYWLILRTVKYSLTSDLTVKRILWYQYYVPMLLIPMFALFVILSLGKRPDYKLPLWTRGFQAVNVLLLLLVMTNDWHQKVFVFPAGSTVYSDQSYTYGWGYGGILCVTAVEIGIALVLMIARSRLPRNRPIVFLPALPIGAMIVYCVLYIWGNPLQQRYAGDVTVVLCLFTIATFESCIAGGLLPINQHYQILFDHTDFPVCIVDEEDSLFRANQASEPLTREIKKRKGQLPVMLDPVTRVSMSPIPGGKVIWAENLSAILEETEKFRDLKESLEESHTIALEEYRTNREKIRLEEANHLYYQMQLQTAPYLEKITALLDEFGRAEEEQSARTILAEIAVYGAYFKRRNNLLFAAETQEKMQGAELGYCFKESLAALSFLGVLGSYELDKEEEYSLQDIMALYDHFENVVEAVFRSLAALAIVVRRDSEVCTMYLNLTVKQGVPAFPPEFEVEQEEETSFLLTYARRTGGDAL